jgi:O-antigen ligase
LKSQYFQIDGFFSSMVLCAVAILVGGGGVGAAIPNLVVQLASLAWFALFPGGIRQLTVLRKYTGLLILVSVTFLVVICQLVPLPAEIWHSLPGRNVAQSALKLVGMDGQAMPFSLDRNRTFIALLSLLPPLALLTIVLKMRWRDIERLMMALVGLGLLNFIIGGVQLVSAQRLLSFYPGAVASHLYGSFANHNSAGLFFVLVICMYLGFANHPSVSSRRVIASVAILILFGSAVILTQSRSATALLILPIVGVFFDVVLSERGGRGRGEVGDYTARSLVMAAIVLVGCIAFASQNGKVAQTVQRFYLQDEIRPRVWGDTVHAIERFWPMGSGTGTFADVFQLDESLENVLPKTAGRAHNDYLEIALETGGAGIAIMVGWGGWCLVTLLRASRGAAARQGFAAGLGLCCIALQSIVDYPLRNQAMLCLFAILLGLLARAGAARIDQVSGSVCVESGSSLPIKRRKPDSRLAPPR